MLNFTGKGNHHGIVGKQPHCLRAFYDGWIHTNQRGLLQTCKPSRLSLRDGDRKAWTDLPDELSQRLCSSL